MENYEKQGNDFLEKHNASLKAVFSHNGKYFEKDTDYRDVYSITITTPKGDYTFQFGQSVANSDKNRKEPTAYDILSCLTKYDPGSFEDFCSDFGYDNDSRSAENTYNAVLDEYKELSRIFTEEQLEEMQEIQ